jgi:hypothetical protein
VRQFGDRALVEVLDESQHAGVRAPAFGYSGRAADHREEDVMSVTIKSHEDLEVASLVTPPSYGYLLFGATVAPPKGPPIVRPDERRQSVLARVSQLLQNVTQLDTVVRATGYRAVVIPPARPPAFNPDLEPPRFDVTVLVETGSPDALAELTGSSQVSELRAVLQASASRLHEIQARCVKAIADFDKPAAGTYLFNYWAAEDPATALEVFDHLAPWFQAKTGLRNSTVLQSNGDDEFAFVNHARWDESVMAVTARQLLRPSFYRFVRPTLAANHINVYPALYRRL